MIAPTDAERALYADLTQLMLRMKGESLALVEATIEERFQAFIRAHRPGRTSRLEITQTYIVHDDVEPWVEYRTEYRVGAEPPADHGRTRVVPAPLSAPLVERRGNVVPFSLAFAGTRSRQRQAPDAPQPGRL